MLVLSFDHGVELRVVGEHGLKLARWETETERSPEVQREEVACALEWGRVHDEDIRALFKKRVGGASVRPRQAGGRDTHERPGISGRAGIAGKVSIS
ncbi:MAG TPA: hypothetical protein VHU80_18855 [Polyangiaceae bacterium]|nr:hypothetical protein [Polyangiaceae bacterium]